MSTFPDTEGDLRTWLRAQTALATLVSTRIFLGPPKTATLPYVVLNTIGGSDDTSQAPIDNAVIRFDVWAATKESAYAVVRALRSVLHSISAQTTFDTHTRCNGAQVDLVLWQPDDQGNARYVVTARLDTFYV